MEGSRVIQHKTFFFFEGGENCCSSFYFYERGGKNNFLELSLKKSFWDDL
jgi:hypothetical protein